MPSSNALSLSLSRRKLLLTLWLIVGVLVGIHVLLTVIHYRFTELPWLFRQIFDVDEEDSFPTWYSAMALLFTALTLAAHAWGQTDQAQNQGLIAWRVLAAGFLFLSIDEIAGMHETLNSVTEMSWAIPGGIVALGVGVFYLRFLRRLPLGVAVGFCIGGAIYVGGAVGIELLTEPFLENDALDTLPYNIWTAVEESMEMGGVLVFLGVLIKHMTAGADQLVVKVAVRR
ncbi:hypothetical protein [Actomonas aquatica]|uniref:Uncharacterized protein n=1 Tax=Actomonas aquatica TaxID=2866162 RepID=A0ABZ1CA24_9BACT|nr:hypothetical protein [Opitutus sp. WL0086]WRQ88353.1 hypothetical protein K1X11_002980 [Opitutus sp. WL0086]